MNVKCKANNNVSFKLYIEREKERKREGTKTKMMY